MEIVIIPVIDFDGYFESIIKSAVNKITNPDIKRIFITAGPYRPYGNGYEFISYHDLHIDFYSAIRTGFGCMDIDGMIEELNQVKFTLGHEHHLLGHSQVMEYITGHDSNFN